MIESNQKTDEKETKTSIMQLEHYPPFWRFVLDFMHEHRKDTFTFAELVHSYQREFPHKPKSRQTYQKQLKKLNEVLDIRRLEQLYISFPRGGPSMPKGKKLREAILSHRTKMSRSSLFNKYPQYCYCSSCGNKNKDALHLHHINGHKKDNRMRNLSVVCANCHYLIHRGKATCISLKDIDPMDSQTLPKKTDQCNLIHSSHKWRFSVKFKGNQPTKGGKISPFGRYRTAIQAIFEYENLTITTFTHTINVWVHQPTGALTEHQKIKARERAYLALMQFSVEHEIELLSNIKDLMLSHHVVEHESLNEALKPVFKGREKEIKEIVGSHICQSSHPGKIEHEGVQGQLTGFKVAKNLEYLCTSFPDDFAMHASAIKDYNSSLCMYNENIKQHLQVMQDIRDTLKEMRNTLKKNRGEL